MVLDIRPPLAEAVYHHLLEPYCGTKTAFRLLVTDLNACGKECAVALCFAVEALGGSIVFLLPNKENSEVLDSLLATFPDSTARKEERVGMREKTPWFVKKEKVAHLSTIINVTTFHSISPGLRRTQSSQAIISPVIIVYEGAILPLRSENITESVDVGTKVLQSYHIGQFDLIWDAEGYSRLGSYTSDDMASTDRFLRYLERKEIYAQTLYDFLKPRGTLFLTTTTNPTYGERLSLHEVDVVFRGEERFKCSIAKMPNSTLSNATMDRDFLVLTRFGKRHKPFLRFPSCPCCQ